MEVVNPAHFGNVVIEYRKRSGLLAISGWYLVPYGAAGIDGEVLPLKEFFERLGITQKDCEKAWKK